MSAQVATGADDGDDGIQRRLDELRERIRAARTIHERRALALAWTLDLELLEALVKDLDGREGKRNRREARTQLAWVVRVARHRDLPNLEAEALWIWIAWERRGGRNHQQWVRAILERLRESRRVEPWHPAWSAGRRILYLIAVARRLVARGDFDGALLYLARARRIAQDLPAAECNHHLIGIIARTATVWAELGELDRAIAMLEGAIERARAVNRRDLVTQIQQFLLIALHRAGRNQELLALAPGLIAELRALGLRSQADASYVVYLGALADTGAWAQALTLARQAQADWGASADSQQRAALLGQLGALYRHLGAWREALACHEDAEQLQWGLGVTTIRIHNINAQGWALIGLGQMPLALERFRRARDLAQEAELAPWIAPPLIGMAHVYLFEHRFREAQEAASQAEALTHASTREAVRHEAVLMLGRIALAAEDLDQAAARSEEALSYARREGLRGALVRALHLAALVQEQRGATRSALRHVLRAIRLYEGMRAELDERWTQAAVHAEHGELYQTALRLVLDRGVLSETRRARIALILSEAGRARAHRDELQHRRVAPILSTFAPASSALGEDEAVLYYTISERHLRVFLLHRGALSVRSEPIRRDQVLHLLQRSMFQLSRPGDAGDVSAEQEAAALRSAHAVLAEVHDLLVGPERHRLAGAKRLIVVPHESLWCVPFVALENGQPALGEAHEVVVAPTLGTYLEGVSAAPPGAEGQPEAIVAGFNTPGGPDAEAEAVFVGELLDGRPLVGAELRTAALLEALKTADVLHVSGRVGRHQLADGQERDLDRMPLADGLLDEAFVSRMSAVPRLVVLSGCDLATGWVGLRGDLFGVARAFLVLRVPALLVSLWPLSAEDARPFLEAFYTAWLRAGCAAAAYREAITAARAANPHPGTWAAFVLFTRRPARDEPASTS